MGVGGGSGHNLSNLLKNSRRKERKAYDGWRESDKKSKGIKTVPVSKEALLEIRDALKKQRKTLFMKRLIAAFGILIITGVVFYHIL